MPPAEHVHWLFATGFLILGLCLLAEALVGPEVWGRRRWRLYLWPAFAFGMGVLMWPVMVFFTTSTIHMLAHGSWAQALMLAGAAELGLARGKLTSRWWYLCSGFGLAVSGIAFLVHEQNPWLFQRSSFLHHALGFVALAASVFPFGKALRPRALGWNAGFALGFVVIAVLLYCDRDQAPIFGHMSPLAGTPQR